MSGPFRQSWLDVGFVHFRAAAADIATRLPRGLSVDTIDGSAWLSLVMFNLIIRPLGGPAIPYLLRFPETNLRTYVLGPDGTPGIWFFSLDAPRLLPVLAGRATYGLPYRHLDLGIARRGPLWTYDSRGECRDRPSSRISLEVGPAIEEPDPVDLFLTERYSLFHESGSRLYRSDVIHPRWPLRRARLVEMWQDLVAAPPARAHFSPGVHTRFDWPRPIARERLTVLIDDDCGVCRASGRWLLRHAPAGSVTIHGNHAPVAAAAGLTREELDRQVWVLSSTGRQGGAAAINRLWREMAWPWRWLAALYRLEPVGRLEDRLYAWLAPRRGRLFGRWFPG